MNNREKYSIVLTSANPLNNPRPKRIIEHLIGIGYKCDVIGASCKGNKESFDISNYYALKINTRSTIKSNIKLLNHGLALILYYVLYALTKNTKLISLIHKRKYKVPHYFKKNNKTSYKVIICENLELLPFAHSKKKSYTKLIFDAREYYPKQFEDRLAFRLLEGPQNATICRKYLPKCDYVLTVSQGLATEYKREFGINPILLRSTPVYHEIQVSETNYDEIKLVHHGVANTNRNLHNLIDIVNNLDSRFSLDLYLGGKSREISRLKSLIKDNVRIRVLNHVPFDEIIPTLSNYDIGLAYYYPTGFNIKHALPNKFFEFIQARLAVLTGPSPDMKDLLDKYGCGFVSEKFSNQSVINLLNNLSVEQIDEAKRASDEAAKVLCWEEESKVLEDILP